MRRSTLAKSSTLISAAGPPPGGFWRWRGGRLEQRVQQLFGVHALHQVLVGADLVAAQARAGVGERIGLDLQEGLDLAASAGSTGLR